MAMAVPPKKKDLVLRKLVMTIMSVTLTTAVADLRRLEHPAKPDASLTFLVVGDWGRQGRFNQSQVALQMGVVGDKMDIDFVVSTGDNFYDEGLKGAGDPLFETSFSTVYNAKGVQKQWYNVMGNHDYRGNVEAQLSPLLTKMDSRWLCFRSFILNAEVVEIFFVDTTPMVDKYFTHPGDETYDWSGVLPRESYISDLLKDLDRALRESSAQWKIVVGHHTIKSAGHHGNTPELGARLLPILLENSVDFYVNGHDHCLQHISSTDSGLQFLTSGGGSKAWKGDVKRWKAAEMKFYYDGQGFMSVHLTHTHVQIRFYDVFGNVLHAWAASKPYPYSALS